jgi:hypothetical protein
MPLVPCADIEAFQALGGLLGPGDGANPNRLSDYDYDNDNETTSATAVFAFNLFLMRF